MDGLNAFILNNFLLIAVVIVGGAVIIGLAMRINDLFKNR